MGSDRPRLTDDQKWKIARWVIAGYSSRKIQRLLAEDAPDGRSPSHVTVCRYAKKVPIDGKVVPWGPGWPEAPEEIAYLFRLLEIENRVELFGPPLDWRAAKWALRLRAALGPADSDNDLGLHTLLARSYAWREREALVLGKPLDTADLDASVMARPWESKERLSQYHQAVKEGRIPVTSVTRDLRALEACRPGSYASLTIHLLNDIRNLYQKQQGEGLSTEEKEWWGKLLTMWNALEKDPEGNKMMLSLLSPYKDWQKQQKEESRERTPGEAQPEKLEHSSGPGKGPRNRKKAAAVADC